MSMTPWFDPSVKPVNAGLYEVSFSGKPVGLYSYWDGTQWYVSASTRTEAQHWYAVRSESITQFKYWRGLL